MFTFRRLIVLCFLCFTAGGIVPAFATSITPGYEFDSVPIASDTQMTLGFWFQATQPVLVTDLGYFDYAGDGFTTAHETAIFDSQGILAASTLLDAGSADPLYDHFRYHSITPVELFANSWYVLAATTGGPADPWGYGTTSQITGLAISPFITILSDASRFKYQSDNTIQFPTDHYLYQLYAGPNMLIADPQAVPEPTSGALVGIGGVLTGLLVSRRFRVSAKPRTSASRSRGC